MRPSILLIPISVYLLILILAGCRQKTPQDEPLDQGIELPARVTEDDAVLVVKGKIRKANPAYFDLETIMLFAPVSFDVRDAWKGSSSTYTGTSLHDLLQFLEVEDSASVLDVIASNGYKVSIRIEDVNRYEYILSYKLNSRLYQNYEEDRNRGPLAIAINFEKYPELDYEIYKHQLVWYVKTILVR